MIIRILNWNDSIKQFSQLRLTNKQGIMESCFGTVNTLEKRTFPVVGSRDDRTLEPPGRTVVVDIEGKDEATASGYCISQRWWSIPSLARPDLLWLGDQIIVIQGCGSP